MKSYKDCIKILKSITGKEDIDRALNHSDYLFVYTTMNLKDFNSYYYIKYLDRYLHYTSINSGRGK